MEISRYLGLGVFVLGDEIICFPDAIKRDFIHITPLCCNNSNNTINRKMRFVKAQKSVVLSTEYTEYTDIAVER